jgi:fibro-slime domain-containing protein
MSVTSGRRSGFLVWLLALLALPSSPEAAKVVLYKSFFGSTPVCLSGGMFVDNTCADTADGLLRDNGRGWLQIVLPDEVGTAAYQNVQFTLNKQGTWSNDYLGNINFFNTLRNSDTVWMSPDPFPGGSSVKSTNFDPTGPGKVKTVMFWSPWTGSAPRLQVGSVSDTMTPLGPNSGLFGWYTQTLVGYSPTTTTLLFSNGARTQFLTSNGLGTSQTPPIAIDSIASTSDTIWIRAFPEVAATGVRSTRALQRPKQIMVFNPWNGFQPNIQQPRIRFGAEDTLRTMVPNADFCGWYSLPYFERAPLFHLVNRKTGQTFGAAGYGSTTGIDVSGLGDTAWVTVGRDSLPRTSNLASLERGVCEITYLAATVRDFASSRSKGTPFYNSEFGPGRGCWKGGWSGVKGMVDTLLGPGRKPVRSAHDTGSYYPNQWTWANRCTFDTLPGTLAEIGDSGIATNWFRTVEGKNAETCRDIPLTLDSVNGNYAHNSPRYFPIDDFAKLESGADNPYFDRINGDDGRTHNYGFCLESHGSFEYTKGQTFKFRGDDDVWFFIDNRLVVDLGGIHGPWEDSVKLDTIGSIITSRWVNNVQVHDTVRTAARLIEGKTYNFDFFFCERNPQGSSMRIETSMNLRTNNGFQLRDTVLGPGRTSYDLYASRISGQGCRAQTLVAKATGRFYLSGPGFVRRPLASGATHHGGIVLAVGGGKATVDSAAIVGLPAGDYQILAVSDLDSTKTEIIRFRVPFTTGPKFVAKPAYTGPTGTSFPVEVAAFSATGPDSAAIVFTMQPNSGLVFYRDSALTSPLAAGDTLRTGANTLPRRLWVKGVLPGSYTLAVGKIVGDSADLWPDVIFLPAKPVFKIRSPFTGTVGSVVAVEVVAVNALGTDSSAAVFGLRPLAGIEYFADSLLTRRILSSDTLRTGINGLPRRLWARGIVAGSYTLVVGSSATDSTDARPNIVFQDKGLRFTTAAGTPLDPFAIEKPLGDTVRLWFETFAGAGTCTTCGTSVDLSASAPGIVFLGAGNLPTTTAPLASGRGSILVRGLQPVDLATVRVQVATDSTARALWSPVSFTVAGPDSASLHDRDGDGRADALVVYLHQPWAASNTVTASWPDAATNLVLGVPSLSGDSLTATFPVASAPLATTGTAAGAWSWTGTTTSKAFPVAERIAPVPLRAVLSRGTLGSPDTLRVRVTESVLAPSVPASLEQKSTGSWMPGLAFSGSLVEGNTLVLLHDGTTPAPSVGDSVRLSVGVSDLSGNVPSTPRRAVVVEGAGPPPMRGWLLDIDGDGAIDHARVLYPGPADPSLLGSQFVFQLEPGSLQRPGAAVAVFPQAPNVLLVALQTPFPVGLTSVANGSFGVVSLSGLPGLDGPVNRADAFLLSDSVAPSVRSAFLRLTESYDAPDTLVVVATEPVASSGTRFLLGRDRASEFVMNLADSRWASPETLMVLQWPSDSSGLRAGDSVRWNFDGSLRDLHTNAPTSASRRQVVAGGARKPVLRLEPPRALTVLTQEMRLATPSLPGIQVQAGSGNATRLVDPATGTVGTGVPCLENRCIGPTLELNQSVRVALLVYDRLGVFVAGTDLEITQATLDAIGTDRLGRTTVKLRWDLADARAKPVAGGIYLMRLLVTRPSEQGTVFVANQVWKVGVKSDEVP